MTITRLQPVISTTGIRKILDNQGREIATVSSLLDGVDNLSRSKESEYVHNAICDSFNRIAELEAQNKRLVDIVDRLCWSIENGDFPESSYWEMYAENARALLAELTA